MFLEERRQNILNILNEKKKVLVEDLSSIFSVSEVTIRKDLEYLEKHNLLKRTHGGAISNESFIDVPALYQRRILNKCLKEKIGIRTAELLKNGETIIIDSGTTTIEVIKHINKIKNLNIITNSLEICNEALRFDNIRIVATGGEIIKDNQSMRSLFAEQVVKNFNANKAIIGVSALSLEHGFTTSDEITARLKKQMLMSSKQKIVIGDSSKFGTVSFYTICKFDEIDILITDNKISKEYLEAFTNKGIKVYIVKDDNN